MGVRSLTSFIDKHDSFFKQQSLLKYRKLVFDGGSLFWSLIRPDTSTFMTGGEYDKLYKTFHKFFARLKKLKITAYIILDGGSNSPLKDETTCDRIKHGIKQVKKLCDNPTLKKVNDLPRPILVKQLFIQVLRDMKIPFIVTKGEADMMTGALANRIGCPVVTYDSDFYIYDLPHGVIQLPKLMRAIWVKDLVCGVYKIEKLVQKMKIEKYKIPFIAVVLGNDFSDKMILKTLQRYFNKNVDKRKLNKTLPDVLSDYLRPFASVEEIVQGLYKNILETTIDQQFAYTQIINELHEYNINCEAVKKECEQLYSILTQAPMSFSKMSKSHEMLTAEETILRLINCGHCNSGISDIFFDSVHFVPVQSEDIAKQPSFKAADFLTEYTYRLLLTEKSITDQIQVKEFCREGMDYESNEIVLSKSGWNQPELPVDVLSNTKVYSRDDKQHILCRLSNFPVENLNLLDGPAIVLLLALKFWTNCCEEPPHDCIVKAVLISHLKCYFPQLSGSQSGPQNVWKTVEKRHCDAAHQFSCFQAILYYFIQLNEFFMRPFQEMEIRKSVNGKLVQAAYHQLCSGNSPESMLTTSVETDHFVKYLHLISRPQEEEKVEEKGKDRSKKKSSRKVPGSLNGSEKKTFDLSPEEIFEVPEEDEYGHDDKETFLLKSKGLGSVNVEKEFSSRKTKRCKSKSNYREENEIKQSILRRRRRQRHKIRNNDDFDDY